MNTEDIEGEEDEENEEQERIWPIDGKNIDRRTMRATDMLFNKRVYLPENNLWKKQEIKIEILKEELIEKTREYVSCNKYENSLTEAVNRGLKSPQEKRRYWDFSNR